MEKKKIIRVLRIIMPVVAVISAIMFAPWILLKAWILPLPDTIQEQAEEAIGHGFDGIIVYVEQSGKQPEYYTAGWKNREHKIPADPHSYFKIASIGKLYVAVAVAKLVYEKRVSLDETLGHFFPELIGRIEYADKITLRMMIQHRSGIPNFTDHEGFWANPPKNSQKALEYALDLPAEFEPDEDYAYSNTNYLLISQIIDKVTGYSHQQYIREKILNPLGLTHTFGSFKEINIDDLMSGYYVGIDEDIKTADYGSMVATAEDVGIFMRELNTGTLLNDEERKIYSSVYEFEHTGLVPGYQSIAKYNKDIDAVIVQFVNTTDFSGFTWTTSEIVCNRIVEILRKRQNL